MQDAILTDNLDDTNDLDDFADLEAMLDDFHAKHDKAKVLKGKRQELTRTRDSGLSEQLQKEILELELTISYTPLALVARFSKQQCKCGVEHTHLDGMFYHSKGSNGVLRWTRTEYPQNYKHLPHVTECVVTVVDLCVECCGEQGFHHNQQGE